MSIRTNRLVPSLVAIAVVVAGISISRSASGQAGGSTLLTAGEAGMQEEKRERSGIEGITEIKISHPVEREGAEPEVRPFQTDLAFLTAGDRREVARLKTGTDGRFRVPLPPGEYIIKPLASRARLGAPRASEHLAKVSPDQFIFVRIIFESPLQ